MLADCARNLIEKPARLANCASQLADVGEQIQAVLRLLARSDVHHRPDQSDRSSVITRDHGRFVQYPYPLSVPMPHAVLAYDVLGARRQLPVHFDKNALDVRRMYQLLP